tara:strand:- start:387 stop:725 length:339 start_codon:yes stop_codon:yes gene_type:complete
MYKMLQHDTPEDWVLATGETYTVRQFAEAAFKMIDLNWEEYIETSSKYYRPNEVEHLLGDSSKARKFLNWKPKHTFDDLVKKMVESDIKLAKKEQVLIKENLLLPTWENPVI